MRLLYIADNGFSFHNGAYYYSRPNAVNTAQYMKYFESICFIARFSSYRETMLPIESKNKVHLVGRYDIKGLKRAMHEMQSVYDAVLVRNGLLGCFAAKYAKQLGKVLISYCGADPFEFQLSQGSIKGKLIAHYWRNLEKKKMMLGDYAHYCTRVLYERYPCRCPYLICSNVSVSTDEIILGKRLRHIKEPHKIIKIGLIGQYNENDRKGITTVIKAMRNLEDNYHFEVVGDGDSTRYSDILSKYNLKERVRFLGYYSEKSKINEWLDELDIYVQPSLSEGLPRATIEAMSRGIPVVASNVCGMIDILSEEYLIKPKDDWALAEKIRSFVEPGAMERASKVNFAKASEYEETIRDEKLDAFYRNIVDMK